MAQEIFEETTSSNFKGPGAILGQLRESKKITIAEAIKHLRLSESRLIALEADDYRGFGSATFARGHLRAYAKWLGHGEEEIVKVFDESKLGNSIPSIKPQWIYDKIAISPRRRHSSGLPYILASLVVIILVSYWYVHENKLKNLSLTNESAATLSENLTNAVDVDAKVQADSSQQSMIVQPLPIAPLPKEKVKITPQRTEDSQNDNSDQESGRDE